MLATCIIVGTIASLPVTDKDEEGNSQNWILVETAKPFRSANGKQGRNTFRVKLWRGIADEGRNGYEKGDAVVIRGRLESDNASADPRTVIIAEKVSYLSGMRA